MIVKRTKQLGNFKKGINLYVPRRPSGIPVATTNSVSITRPNFNYVFEIGTYTKVTSTATRVAGSAASHKMFVNTGLVYLKEAGETDGTYTKNPFYVYVPYGYILIPPNTTFTSTYYEPLTPQPYWRMGVIYGDSGEEGAYFLFANGLVNSNPSTDPSIIPTSGWDYATTITTA
jgi:hypothetical protein